MLNKKVTSISLCMCFAILFSQTLFASPKTIMFLPFINMGNYRYDKLKTHIPNYLYEPVKDVTDYHVISYAREYRKTILGGTVQ
jgi:hypothetical protein